MNRNKTISTILAALAVLIFLPTSTQAVQGKLQEFYDPNFYAWRYIYLIIALTIYFLLFFSAVFYRKYKNIPTYSLIKSGIFTNIIAYGSLILASSVALIFPEGPILPAYIFLFMISIYLIIFEPSSSAEINQLPTEQLGRRIKNYQLARKIFLFLALVFFLLAIVSFPFFMSYPGGVVSIVLLLISMMIVVPAEICLVILVFYFRHQEKKYKEVSEYSNNNSSVID